MIAVTAASGQLGRHVINALLKQGVAPTELIVAVRSPEKVDDMADRGIHVRQADYDRPETLRSALKGVDKLLLISASELGKRVEQHRNVIEAAKAEGVKLLVYTSILHADSSPLGLADEHRETERLLKESGLPYVLLRNGWYTENYLSGLPTALQHGALIGSAGDGRISSAARKDYAEAAAIVLTSGDHSGQVYELAGDESYTLSELAEEISRQVGGQGGQPIRYQDMPQADYHEVLLQAGLPEAIANMLSDSDAGVAQGGLFDDSRQLSALIGRPTTPLSVMVMQAHNSLGE